MKVRVYPECASKDGQQPGNEFLSPPASGLASFRFIPGFVRRRPLRAVLLAAAVFAIPYSLVRHQGDVNAPRVEPVSTAPAPAAPAKLSNVLPMSSVAMESVSGPSSTSWRPPIGMDRTNEALDHLTMDLTSGPKPAPGQTPDHHDGFQAGTHVTSAEMPQPAPAEAPAKTAPAKAPAEAPAATAAVAPAIDTPADVPIPPRTAKARPLDEIDQYLWGVYQRSLTKRDSSGDFTWKDEAAAARMGLVTKQYVIGGMDRDFRELLYNLGHAMDEAGLHWTILSGFRDDYRQGLASGYKAHIGNSFHGGSRATGGYGHGCAADIEAATGEDSAVWKFVDQHGEKFGLFRPMKQIDPAHIQPFGGWHDVAFNMRDKRNAADNGYLPASVDRSDTGKVTTLVDTRSGVSESQFDCVRSHNGGFHIASLSHHQRIMMGGHMHRAAMFRPWRMHRFGRRRMVVDTGSTDRHEGAETVVMADRTDGDAKASIKASTKAVVRIFDTENAERRAKAEASDKNRRDARRDKMAETGRSERRFGKETSPHDDGDKRIARTPDAKDQKVADSKNAQKRAAVETSKHQAKAAMDKAAKSKSGVHVADEPDASGKKKL